MGNITANGSSMNCTIDHTIHQTLAPVVYVTVLVVGFPANCLSLYFGYLQIKARNELGVYLCNLTVADLLYICSLPFWLQYVLQHDNWLYGDLSCQVCGILLYENIYISVGFLCCISIDRYLAVAHPFRFHQFRTLKAAVGVSVVIWAKELLASVYFLLHKEVVEDGNQHRVCFEHYPLEPWQRGINYYRFLVGFLFPLCLLLAAYRGILRAVHRSHGTQKSRKDQIQRLVLSTMVIFLACFLPYHVLLLVRSLWESSCQFAKGIFNVYHFSLLLTSVNCVADPVLYCFVSETTHRDLARLCAACRAFLTCSRTGGPREAFPLGAPEASTGKNEEPELLRKLHSTTFQTSNSPGGAGSPTARLA
ncbi:ovarian cancer G-protein coupled receptor 1 [Artibeus jamaicensis]|uniref:ovarian cancer G-protein coupled receptor 1 n=1 Tax=Artibeus jamaicensis TaxID=9417 RepID=UPI00235B27A7|nr:ovarian cancer G-protein coupled receptor 1 [Artibeus jamaicensis]XP_036986269.2 ovarian cancer G-protein coupled receptor 1 [Artibeus jamaicensis]XP_036986272.2 ovarian cancer G-protein coupled receptor 1 [Artibeus jamaicensis]